MDSMNTAGMKEMNKEWWDERVASSTTTSSNSTDQDAESDTTSSSTTNNSTIINQFITQQYQFNLQDIEKAIGFLDENVDILKWLDDFNDYSKLFNWNDLQKFIIVKKLLTGLPKLFIESEHLTVSSWSELKTALINEFSVKLNTYQLHKILSERKLNKDESLYEYFLKMKEIASRGTIEFESFISYIINGIPDDLQMKYLLCDVKSMHELKEKLKIMSKFQNKLLNNKNKNGKKKIAKVKQEDVEENENDNENIVELNNLCLNCGENGHDKNNCPFKNNQSTTQNVNNLSQESIQQITDMILPYFTNSLEELNRRLKEISDKLTNTKIEVERLSELTSRHTISLASHDKRLQGLEDREKTIAGFLAGSQLKDKLKPPHDNNLLKSDKKSSQKDKKKSENKKVNFEETSSSDESDNSSDTKNSSKNNSVVKKNTSQEMDNNLLKSDKKSSQKDKKKSENKKVNFEETSSSDESDSSSDKKNSSKNNSVVKKNTSQEMAPLMNMVEGFAQFLSKLDL